jgi:hypothetical protein
MLTLGLLAAGALPSVDALAVTVQQVIDLTADEMPEDKIIKKIQKEGTTFNLSAKEILQLKKGGVSDKVIKFMLSTSAPAGKGDKDKAAPPPEKKRELSAAEQKAEEARLREEALKLAEEERKRQAAQQQAFSSKVTSAGLGYAESGDFVNAIKVFSKFMEEGNNGLPFAPDSDEAYNANYGMAIALVNAGLWQSGASKLLDVVRAGPDKTFFDEAFVKLRELRRKINYRPPELEDLTKFQVLKYPQEFQDGYNYFVGEFLHDFGLAPDAKPYLERVGKSADDYAKAQYLLGLIAFEDETADKKTQLRDASQAFQKAVVAAEKQGKAGQPVVDLAYLALARLTYEFASKDEEKKWDGEQSFYDVALYYYKKVSRNSPKLSAAFYEAGWSYFLKNDVSRALGTFQALHSPYFAHHFYPELWILEATIYVNTCQVESAREAMNMFEKHVLVLAPPLRDFIKKNRKPEEFYASFVEAANSKAATTALPRPLQSPVLENVEFFNLYQTIRQIEREEATLKDKLAVLGQGAQGAGQFGQDLLARLGQLKQERVSEAGVIIQKAMRTTSKDIDTYHDKLLQLQIDLLEAEQQVIDDKIAGKAKKEGQAAQEGTIAIAGSDSMVWPFEGEFWKDEIGAYRSFVRNRCKVDKDDDGGAEGVPGAGGAEGGGAGGGGDGGDTPNLRLLRLR